MNTKTKALLGATVLAIALLVIFASNSKQANVTVVMADDGSVELRIPEGTIITEGSLDQIKISPRSAESFFDATSSEEAKNAKVYDLLPDGLTFETPVSVVVTLPYENGQSFTPILLTQSGDDVSVLNIQDVQFDETKKTATITTELSHFSILIADAHEHIFTVNQEPKEATLKVGESFDHTFTVTPGFWEYTNHPSFNNPDYWVRVRLEVGNGTRWTINTDFRSPHETRTLGYMQPNRVVREKRDLGSSQAYNLTTTFTCAKPGTDKVSGLGSWMTYTLQMTTINSEDSKPRITRDVKTAALFGLPDSTTITCVALGTIQVIDYAEKKIPLTQVHSVTGLECDEEAHYHAISGSATALDGAVIADPGECGYGKVRTTPIETIEQ